MLLPIFMMTGIVLGLFLGILLLTLERGNKKANRFLGIIMILSSIFISDFALSKLGFHERFPYIIGIAPTMLFLIGPFFYFYIKVLIGRNVTLKGKTLFHFVPFLLLISYRLPFYFHSAQSKLDILHNSNFYAKEHWTIILIQAIHTVIYLIILKRSIPLYAAQIKSSSEMEGINLRWIKKLMNIISFIFGFVVLLYILNLAGVKLNHIHSTIIPFVITATVLYIGFTGLRQPIIFPLQQENTRNRKYENSTLTEEKANQYLEKLYSLMENEKLYLQSDLTLQKLAESMSVLPNHLSQVINEKLNQNFVDFINSFRVKSAQEMLKDPGKEVLTMIAIGYEAGFNSKSSFNTAFKKHTGLTPSEYKAECQKQKLQPEA